MTFEDRPPAKVNLSLRVVGRRPDGYHELRSVFLRIGLTDRLTMQAGGADGSDTLVVTGLPGVPVRDNLVLRALDALRGRLGIELPALDATLEKRIPAAAGLGGGSSDCASALKLAQASWGVGLSNAEELGLAAELGSDVPFFVSGVAAAVVEGRGETVSSVPAHSDAGLLLVTPPIALSTARVYTRYDDLGGESRAPAIEDIDIRDLANAADRLRDANDLWPAAASLEPSLEGLRESLERASGRAWLMSGSGPTLFCVYPSIVEAAEAGNSLVASRLSALGGAIMNAVDLVGPDPTWRYP